MDEHLVLYRKYRPKNFFEVVGQEHIVQTLKNAVKFGKISHAYLFSGPRGTGKTTLARIFTKAINCENLKNNEPCNECLSCQEIQNQNALDLIEMDAASNRGIDEIRNLREAIRFSPVRLKYKVYIIDEAHMLTKEAFNALLKTLEEPPERVVFILATTEPEKMPATILSRIQRFDFRKINLAEIVKRLKKISEAENIKIEDSALKMIALNADGCLRDAESLLGQIQIISMTNENISSEDISKFLGIFDFNKVVNFIDFIIKKDLPSSIKFLNKLNEDGYDVVNFVKSLINYLRKILILKINPEFKIDDLTFEQKQILNSQSQKLTLEEIHNLLHNLISGFELMKKIDFPLLALEMVVVDFLQK